MTAQPLTFAELLDRRAFDQNQVPPAEQVVFSIEGKTIGSLQSFIGFTGLPKAGKSKFIAAAVASAFMPGDMFGFKLHLPQDRRRIGYFDTEQTDYEFFKHMTLLKNFAGLNGLPDWFNAFKCREDNSEAIKGMIETYLTKHPDCSAVVLDGYLDLLRNFNDESESKNVIDWLKRITKQYNVLLIGVLHLGKGTGNTLGHFGSMLDRYCQSLLKIEKDKAAGLYTCSAELLRSAAEDVQPISIMHSGGQWIQTHAEAKPADNKPAEIVWTIDGHRMQLQHVYKRTNELEYKKLLSAVCECYGIGPQKSKKVIRDLIQKNLITKNQNELYERTA